MNRSMTAAAGLDGRFTFALQEGWEYVGRRMSRRWLRGKGAAACEEVRLPHCWNDKDTFQEGVAYRRGPGSYRRSFLLPEPAGTGDFRWRLESEGFYGTGDLWINGRKVSDVDGQYLGLSLDVTDWVREGSENRIGLRLTNRCRSYVLPGHKMPDFLLHGGLAGRAWLHRVPACRLEPARVRIWCEEPLSARPRVHIVFAVCNESGRLRRGRVAWRIVDAAGRLVAAAEPMTVTVDAGGQGSLREVVLELSRPSLWSPHAPNLYAATGSWTEDGAAGGDEVSVLFGIRAAEFRPDEGFFLNGERLELRGCNRHESMPGFGSALPDSQHWEDAWRIREAGLNFVRLSHYPQHPAFLDACDRLGILVYAEIATWKSVRTGRWLKRACRQLNDMILRDRNRPSIVLWGLGNESRSRRAYEQMRGIAVELDPTRPVLYAENHLYRARRQKTLGIVDVWGCNYELDELENGREASLLRSVVVSEFANYPHSLRGVAEEELRQVATIEEDLRRIRQHPFVAGFCVWCFNDYATLRKKRYRRFSGIVDAWRWPKMSSALLRVLCGEEPFVRAFGDWSEPGAAGTAEGMDSREIRIFARGQEVRVTVNGRECLRRSGGVVWTERIPFEPGELCVEAVAADGRIAADRLSSWGAAERVTGMPGVPMPDRNGTSTLALTVRVLDGQGRTVRNWNGDVFVETTGDGRAHSFAPDGRVYVRGGVGRCFVSVPPGTASARVKVSAAALAGSECEVQQFEAPGAGVGGERKR